MNLTYLYLLCDDGGVSNCELPVLMSIGSKFRHEYGIYKVIDYRNDTGTEETKFSLITQVTCEREYKLPNPK